MVERTLRDADELVLVTRGRRSGQDRAVTLRFAYADGAVWLRTEPRDPPRPAASTVVVRRRASRLPEWYLNLEADPRCRVRLGERELAGTARPVADREAALRHVVALWREKYGADQVADWYVDAGRVPVRVEVGGEWS